MPPRYAYWTILVDEQPTAFRASSQEDLMPTFKRLKAKNVSAKMMWWQNGKLWDSRLDAQEAMRARGEMGRAKDFRQRDARPGGGFRDRPPRREPEGDGRDPAGKLDWKPKTEGRPSDNDRRPPRRDERPAWEPKAATSRDRKPEWRPKAEGLAPREHLLRRSVRDAGQPAWKPKGDRKPEWKPKGAFSAKTDDRVRPRGSEGGKAPRPARRNDDKLEWRPKGSFSSEAESRPRRSPGREDGKPSSAPKRKWVPKQEYKKSQGIEARRDKNWRPGGEHKDPRQKYKDAKKAKWGRFKQNIRQKWEAKGGRKKRDE
jgi:hypothetical protein